MKGVPLAIAKGPTRIKGKEEMLKLPPKGGGFNPPKVRQ
jgi:hypothetical protein